MFEPTHGVGPINLTKIWNKVRSEAELPETIGLHGLRHSLASHMAMEGAQASEIMAALGHRNITTSAKYVHWASQKRQPLAEKAAAVALAGLAASIGTADAEVLRTQREQVSADEFSQPRHSLKGLPREEREAYIRALERDLLVEAKIDIARSDAEATRRLLSDLAAHLRANDLPPSGREYLAAALEQIGAGGNPAKILPKRQKRRVIGPSRFSARSNGKR